MHRPPLQTGLRRTTFQRKLIRPSAIIAGVMGLLLVASFGADLEANEVQTVRRSGDPAQFEPIAVASLPTHRASVASNLPDVGAGPKTSLRRALPALVSRSSSTPKPGAFERKDHNPEQTSEPLSLSSGVTVINGKISRGQSLSTLLRARGVSSQMVRTIDREIRSEFDLRKAQPGDTFRLNLDHHGELMSFRYRSAPDESIVLRRSGKGYAVRREALPLEPQLARMQGTVESSLYTSIRGLGHDPQLASAFADIFAWEIDFTRNLKQGDGFTILYERLYRQEDGSKVYVRPGRILAAQFKGKKVGEHTAVYFEEENGIGSYFRPDGDTLEEEFLVAPLKFSRISSNYSERRNHPILNVVRPHHGIDYAARTGTPLWAVADGTVISRGVNGGFGNLVKIRHANGYVSYYAHLSGYSPGLAVGQKVQQKQVIGYVGQTGLATGPHVCFRVTKYGKYVDPATLNHDKPVHRSVTDASWADFEIVRDQLLANMREGRQSEFAGNAL